MRRFPVAGFGVAGQAAEIRQAVRSLSRTPWYSVTVVSVIALSMALLTTVFAIVDGVLFKRLPYRDAEEIYVVTGTGAALSLQETRDWAAAVPAAQVTAYQRFFDIGSVGSPRPSVIRGAAVGPNFFEVLGVQPLLGAFTAADFDYNTSRLPLLISYGLWQRQFGGRTDVIGQHFVIAGAVNHLRLPLPAGEVVGVLAQDFVFPSSSGVPDVLIPLTVPPGREREVNYSAAALLVRVPFGRSLAPIEGRLSALNAARQAPSGSTPGRSTRITLRSAEEVLPGFYRGDLRNVFVGATVLMLIACVNVAGLGMARQRHRLREFAVRRALGASGWRLVRLMAVEIAPLVALGTAAGLVVTRTLLSITLQLLPPTLPLLKAPAIDWRVLAFSAVASVFAITVVVLTGGRAATRRTEARDSLKTTGTRDRRLDVVAIAAQVALTLVLAVGGALVVRSLYLVWQNRLGFDADGVAFVEVNARTGSAEETAVQMARAIDAVSRLPTVDDIAVVHDQLLRYPGFVPVNRFNFAGGTTGDLEFIGYAGNLFRVLGISAVAGRLPTAAELSTYEPVVVVSQTAARKLWGDEPAVGRMLVHSSGQAFGTVIGVVRDARLAGLDYTTRGQFYLTRAPRAPQETIVLKTAGRTADVLALATGQLEALGAPIEVLRTRSLVEALGDSVSIRAFRAWLFGGFAAAALVIASVGILGLVAMSAARRTRELGIRIALGAQRQSIVRLLLREQVTAVLVGLIVGSMVAAWAVRFIRSQLYSVATNDVGVWMAAGAVVVVVAAAGALVPAWRASHVDPVRALRVD
jgi:predicted permease